LPKRQREGEKWPACEHKEPETSRRAPSGIKFINYRHLNQTTTYTSGQAGWWRKLSRYSSRRMKESSASLGGRNLRDTKLASPIEVAGCYRKLAYRLVESGFWLTRETDEQQKRRRPRANEVAGKL